MPVRAMRVGSTQSNTSTPRRDDVEDADRVADAHEVAQPVRRQQLVHELDRGEHLVAALADAEAADGVGVEADAGDLGGRPPPQRLVDAALHDAR